MATITFSIDRGFSIMSKAPSLVAVTAVSMLPWPVMITTGKKGWFFLISRSVSMPSMPGIQISSTTKSGDWTSMIFNAS